MKTNKKGYTSFEILATIFLIGIVGATILAPLYAYDTEGATRVLKANGFTDIKITGYKWFNGTQDYFNTGFIATAPDGTKVSGNVSRGIFFKGSTVRLD